MNKFKVFLVFIYFLLSKATIVADTKSLEWVEANHFPLRYRINLENLFFEKEISRHQWQAVGKIQITEKETETLIDKFSSPNTFFPNLHTVRFVIQGTGLVYDFNKNDFTFKRKDHTKHSGYNFSATRFYRNQILYSAGGEGFWNYNKHITYFDEIRNKEWELFRTENVGPEVISNGYQGFSKNADAFFSGGDQKKQFLVDEYFIDLPGFYKLDFKTKKWEKLGDINEILKNKEHYNVFWNGNHFVQLAGDKVYLINPIKNSIHVYQDNTMYFDNGTDFYILNDTILNFKNGKSGVPQLIPVNHLLKKSAYVGKFYSKNYTIHLILLIGLLVTILGVFCFIKWRKKHQPKFNDLELKLLNFFIDSKNKEITTNDLNDILDCSNKSQESQRRIRHIIINQINSKFEYNHQIKNVIIRIPSEEDKRIYHYQISPSNLEKIEKIIHLKD